MREYLRHLLAVAPWLLVCETLYYLSGLDYPYALAMGLGFISGVLAEMLYEARDW
jgi:hypothetical protein